MSVKEMERNDSGFVVLEKNIYEWKLSLRLSS